MSKKARRRPSWKKKDTSSWEIILLNEEDDSLIETIRLPYMGHLGKKIISKYGYYGAETWVKNAIIKGLDSSDVLS